MPLGSRNCLAAWNSKGCGVIDWGLGYCGIDGLAMRVLIFEWLSSGGLWYDGALPSVDCPIQRQGGQMLNAIASDLALAGLEVLMLVDSRLPASPSEQVGLKQYQINGDDDLPALLLKLAQDADRLLVIAPETDSILDRCLSWLESVEGKLLNPDAAFAKLAGNKSELFGYLESNGWSQFPSGLNFQTFLDRVADSLSNNGCHSGQSGWSQEFRPPAVLKPVDGAGSEEVFLITDWVGFQPSLSRPNDQYRLERFVPGTPVSVSVLCGGDHCDVLAPTIQLFDKLETPQHQPRATRQGHYVGAKFPIDKNVSRRAVELACEVMTLLPKTRGYLGMDLMISDSSDRSQDCLIEINPRLTMSYGRLAEIYGSNTDWETSHLGATPRGGPTQRSNLAMRMVEKAIQPQTNSPVVCTFQEPCP